MPGSGAVESDLAVLAISTPLLHRSVSVARDFGAPTMTPGGREVLSKERGRGVRGGQAKEVVGDISHVKGIKASFLRDGAYSTRRRSIWN